MRHEFEWVSGGEYARESAKATGLNNSSENCISGKKPHALPKIWFRADACDMRISQWYKFHIYTIEIYFVDQHPTSQHFKTVPLEGTRKKLRNSWHCYSAMTL